MKVPDHVYTIVCLRSLIYMSHVNKVQPICVKMVRIAAIRVNFCLLLLSNGISVGIGHICNMMHVYHDTIIKCATLDSFCFLFIVWRHEMCGDVGSMFPYPSPTLPLLYPSHNPLPDMCLHNACSGQCPRCDVSVTWVALPCQGHTKK
jgi:hypothetical protein